MEFLEEHEAELERLTIFPGVESVGLDFGIGWRDVAVQSDAFPSGLVKLAGKLGLYLMLSLYPSDSGES